MKLLFGPFIFLIPCLHLCAQDTDSMKPGVILKRVSQKLNGLKNIRYTGFRELNYASENYHNTSQWSVYFEFYRVDTKPWFKYLVDDAASKQIFNGTEKFQLHKTEKTSQIEAEPDQTEISNISALYNSVITLKYVLLLLVNDEAAIKSAKDTSIDGKHYIAVTVNIGKRRIQNSGEGFDAMTTQSNFIYSIVINTKTYLPVEVLQQNNLNEDFIKTSFNNIEINTVEPAETSWYYSTYASEYKPATGVAIPALLPVGSLAPQWKLSLHNERKTVSLKDLKGTVILLDFWIKNCSPCIESVPHLNELQNKFKGKKFKVISINLYDTKQEVNWFCNKHKAGYPVLLNGKVVAPKYGVSSFPSFFIIDKVGKIVYAGEGFNTAVQSAIEQVIQQAL